MTFIQRFTRSGRGRTRVALSVAGLSAVALGLTACGGSSDGPLATDGSSGSGAAGTVNIGSADFPESQLIAEIYAGALDSAGVSVNDSKMGIGSREVYLKALGDGSIDLIPDYTGNLLQAVDSDNTSTTKEDINKDLPDALDAKNLAMLDPAMPRTRTRWSSPRPRRKSTTSARWMTWARCATR